VLFSERGGGSIGKPDWRVPRRPGYLAAEADGQVIGFILGKGSGWEYGIPENIGWIDTLGVIKPYQKKGIARLLFNEMASMFRKVGVDKLYVFVNWNDWDLLKFFERMGFERGDMLNLELKIGSRYPVKPGVT
jgi:N-acetylglutamate synthase-like GNAT family acetyltransferase